MNIKIHRGAHEIGGSCLEVEHENTRIVVDVGMPLYGRDGQKFDMDKYQSCVGAELVEQHILPDVSGLYAWDIKSKPINGVLISHAHMDHYGLYRFVNKGICCYAGEGTKKLIDLTEAFTPYSGTFGKFSPIQSGVPFSCGSFSITPYLMDHSAFDAYAFLIEAGGKKVIYSGDFREHGRKTKVFHWFLHNAPRGVDALLLEGTMFGRANGIVKTETEIEEEITGLLQTQPGIALIYASGQNIDRLVSSYKAARRTNRLFVIDVYTAAILDELKEFASLPHAGSSFENIRVFYPEYLSRRMMKEGQEAILASHRDHEITVAEISANPGKIVMMIRASMLKDLNKIDSSDGGVFVYSVWEGYLKEKSMKPMQDWIQQRNLLFKIVHTSGHASIGTLRKVVDALKPKRIIPMHTFYPEQYAVLRGKENEIKEIKDGDSLVL